MPLIGMNWRRKNQKGVKYGNRDSAGIRDRT